MYKAIYALWQLSTTRTSCCVPPPMALSRRTAPHSEPGPHTPTPAVHQFVRVGVGELQERGELLQSTDEEPRRCVPFFPHSIFPDAAWNFACFLLFSCFLPSSRVCCRIPHSGAVASIPGHVIAFLHKRLHKRLFLDHCRDVRGNLFRTG